MPHAFRMIVTDMDGTLLDAEHRLPQGFSSAVHALNARGIRWVIASGRQLANLKKRFEALAVPVDIIAENGALAQCFGETTPFYCDLTPADCFIEILNVSLGLNGATPVLCGAGCAYVHDAYPENFQEVSRYFEQTQQWQRHAEIAILQICKVAIYHRHAADVLYPALAPFASDSMRVILSGPNWVDVQAAGIDKGNALNALMHRFNYPPASVVVFGDYLNDVGMLQGGVHAVAMANALPEVRALTPHHTLANTQNGVLHYLQKIGLLP